MKKILISAPYMLKDRTKVETILSTYSQFSFTFVDKVNERLEENDLLNMLPEYDGIICGDDRFNESVFQQCKKLKVIVKWGTGIDSINIDVANKYGVVVCRTPDAFTVPVSETTIGYMLSFCRNLVQNDSIIKKGGWDKPQGFTLSNSTVGIIGFGEIGKAVASKLRPFGGTILAYDKVEIPSHVAQNYGVAVASFDDILSKSNFITVHCDLNPSSKYLLNEIAFQKMHQQPFIINTARGPIIKEVAMIAALKNNMIAGAGLDVFEDEPLPLDSPLRSMENVLLASHNSNSSKKHWEFVHYNSVAMMAKELGHA
jgi:D-3-phosphoglycerate dehydrogenase